MSEADVKALLAENEAATRRAGRRQALLNERAGYELRGFADRVAQVDEQIAFLEEEGPIEIVAVDVSGERERARAEMRREDWIRALLEEREHYLRRNLPDRVAAVDAELSRLGAEGEAPRKRAEKRPADGAPRARR